jgi:hypothetical protein
MTRPPARIISSFCLLALGACTIGLPDGSATTPSPGWHPQSEREMRQIIGETTFMAMDQYAAYLHNRGEQVLQDPLKGLDNAPKPTH